MGCILEAPAPAPATLIGGPGVILMWRESIWWRFPRPRSYICSPDYLSDCMRLNCHFPVAAALSLTGIAAACGGGGTEPSVGPPAAISAVNGGNPSVTAGSATALPLAARVTDAAGHAVPRATVSWSTASGSISPSSATTDGDGQSSVQWTPGTTAGAQTAAATVSGAGTATFTATVVPGALAKIKLAPDTVKLLSAGATAQIAVTPTDAFDNPVAGATLSFSSRDATVATVGSTGLVTAVNSGTTTIDVQSGSLRESIKVVVSITSQAVQCDAAGSVTLAVGESATLTGALASQICVNGAVGAEFVAIPFFATGSGGSGSGSKLFTPAPGLSITLSPIANTTVSGPPSPSVSSNSRLRTSTVAAEERGLRRDVAWEARFRERVRRQFGPLIESARRARRSASAGALRNISISPDVVIGASMQLNVDLDHTCDSVTLVSATVKAVSTRAIVVSDDRNPANGFTSDDFQSFAATFDAQAWPVDTDNFGVPTDIDGNSRVILFFTRAVNELTPANQNSFVGGFFFGRDLYKKTDKCGGANRFVVGSNEAEMFYLLAPDPDGTINKNVRSTSFVKSITAGTVAHEFQHLINFGRHFSDLNPTLFSQFEEPFLDEGLSHVAEELNYYAASGLGPRSNLDAATVTSSADAYQAFARQNALRFREYLRNPDLYPPYSVLADTSLAVRGAIWSFLRYATDIRTSTAAEKTTWFQLANPTSDVAGINNLKAVFGADLLLQIRDWAVSNYLDDALAVSIPRKFQQLSWNVRSVETFVNGANSQNGTTFPLKTLTLASAPLALSLSDGGAAYLRFGVSNGSRGGATVTSSSALPSTFSITVIRTR